MSTLIEQFFLSFGLISLVAVAGGFLSARWKQPTVMGLLFVGMVVGPHALGIIQNNDLISLLAELGATLLLFSIGVEFSLTSLFRSGVKSIIAASAIMLVLFIVGYEAAIFLGMGLVGSLAIGATFSFSSTAIFIRLLKSYGLIRSPFVPLLLSVLVIEDIVAVTAMAFFGSLRAEGAELTTITGILFSILSSLVLMVFAYAVLMKLLQKFIETYKQSFKKEYIMQFALALSVLMAFLAMAIGLSPAVGAFLAGSIISRLSIREEVESTMSHFTLAFSSYFFISIGLLVNPIILIAELPVILGLSALFWVFAFLSTAIVAFLTGQTTRDSIFAGMSMAVMGEFSLLLAKEASPLLPSFDMVTVFASIVFITATFTSITLSRREQICHFVCAHQPRSLFSRLVLAQRYLSSVITEFESGGKLVRNTKAHFSEITKNLALFAGSGFVILLLRTYLKQENFAIPILNARVPPDAALLLFLLLLPSLFKLAFSMRDVADSASQVFLKHGYVRRKDIKHKLLENASIFLVLAGLFIFFPIASRLLLLPGAFGLVSMLPLLGMLIVAYSTIRLILRFFSRDGLAN